MNIEGENINAQFWLRVFIPSYQVESPARTLIEPNIDSDTSLIIAIGTVVIAPEGPISCFLGDNRYFDPIRGTSRAEVGVDFDLANL